jgi:hypothetical protein
MDVKEAVAAAKQHIRELFAEEAIENLGLEEVEFNDQAREWQITLGFSRPWNIPSLNPFADQRSRSYKVVRISEQTGKVISVKNRETVE